MSETLRFDCPACGIHLVVPVSAAGVAGPCPRCGQIIAAPLPEPEVPPAPPEPPPLSPPPQEEVPAEIAAPEADRRSRTSPLLACALTGLVALGIGYGIGRSTGKGPATPPPDAVPPPVPTVEAPPEPIGGETVSPAIAAPEAVLRSFLAAPDHTERLRHSLFPEHIAPRVAEWYAAHPDGPVEVSSIKAEHSETDRETGRMLLIFQVATATMPSGIPVAVMETEQGWKVDWESFIEFHADLFKLFAESRDGKPADFHVIARNTHYLGEPFKGVERFTAYRLDPPMPDRGQYAFVTTGSELQKQIARSTEGGLPFTPVLKLAKRSSGDGKIFIEITGITATDWRPRSPY